MMPCQTSGMCAPHGGCQPEKRFEDQHLDLGKFVDWVYALKAERDQLKTENTDLHATLQAAKGEIERLKGENEALRKEREGKVLVSLQPSPGLLMSMAIRNDHALGCPGYYDQTIMGRKRGYEGVSHARMLECALTEMRKLYEEVVGAGFYSPEKEAGYVAMSKEASHD
ncbi:hypothetical protein SAMN05216605_12838 [Pseudomonas abietaniphila]|uniref:Uncharacterized protein n=2 Tax=Pseudomonas abietaniphila TaxID=89065 RepID=A0A1G8TEC3_9PSED|nr:hypothetical protein SAMN05216605_12838 [Pseudomonas abietaniphila]